MIAYTFDVMFTSVDQVIVMVAEQYPPALIRLSGKYHISESTNVVELWALARTKFWPPYVMLVIAPVAAVYSLEAAITTTRLKPVAGV